MPNNDAKPKYIPFSDPDEFLGHYGGPLELPRVTLDYFYRFLDGMWIRNKYTNTLHQVISILSDGVYLGGVDNQVCWDELFYNFEFLDSSPCGKEVKDV